MFSSSAEKLEKKIKGLNAVKGEYRSDLEESEKLFKRREMDREQFERIKSRNEEHIERINEKIRECHAKMQEMRKK
jgi:di/tripeptidase